jgi:hypothetical protein
MNAKSAIITNQSPQGTIGRLALLKSPLLVDYRRQTGRKMRMCPNFIEAVSASRPTAALWYIDRYWYYTAWSESQ